MNWVFRWNISTHKNDVSVSCRRNVDLRGSTLGQRPCFQIRNRRLPVRDVFPFPVWLLPAKVDFDQILAVFCDEAANAGDASGVARVRIAIPEANVSLKFGKFLTTVALKSLLLSGAYTTKLHGSVIKYLLRWARLYFIEIFSSSSSG